MSLTVSTQIAPEDSLLRFREMLESVSFADELLIYNFGRTDQEALSLFNEFKAKVTTLPAPKVVEYIRARQVQDAQSDWVLIMDFDEVITPALKIEILSHVHQPSTIDHYSAYGMPRRNYSLGFPLKYGGWGTDKVIRLFNRKKFVNWPKEIHSTPQFDGDLGMFAGIMEHHKDDSLEYIVTKTNRYTDQEAKQFLAGGLHPVTSFTLIRKLKMEMLRRGVFKLGLLDGKIGLIQSIYQGFSVFTSYAKLFELQQQKLHKSKTNNPPQ